jgi:hypothetical protein
LKYSLLIFALALLPQTIASQNHNPLAFDTGNDIYSACTSNDTTSIVACRAFIFGVTVGYCVTTDSERYVKIPNNVTRQQVEDVVMNFLTQHPEKRQKTSVSLITGALHEAWPAS